MAPTSYTRMMAHPLRPRILDYLQEHNEGSPKDIARALGEKEGDVSYHTTTLRKAGYIKLVRTEPRRGTTKNFYGLVVARSVLGELVGLKAESAAATHRRDKSLSRQSLDKIVSLAPAAVDELNAMLLARGMRVKLERIAS